MSIFCIGVNYQTAPVEIRERLAFAEETVPQSLRDISSLDAVEEVTILSTCNRVEIYGTASTADSSLAIEQVSDYVIEHFQVDAGQIEFYSHQQEEAAHHLFEVASGLNSMVLGETEIFGQVKKAYAIAVDSGTTSRQLNKLFQQSFRVGKLVRSNTQIQQGATSVGAAAVDLAEKIFGRLEGCHVLIVGAGEMSRITAQSLQSRGASEIFVTNRSYDKAEELAGELGGKALQFDDWERVLRQVDIVISSTSAPGPVIRAEMIDQAMRQRRGRSLFLIDIAVPRDIEAAVDEISNAYLYNIDELQQLADEGRARREKQIGICREVIRNYVEDKGIDALKTNPNE